MSSTRRTSSVNTDIMPKGWNVCHPYFLYNVLQKTKNNVTFIFAELHNSIQGPKGPSNQVSCFIWWSTEASVGRSEVGQENNPHQLCLHRIWYSEAVRFWNGASIPNSHCSAKCLRRALLNHTKNSSSPASCSVRPARYFLKAHKWTWWQEPSFGVTPSN